MTMKHATAGGPYRVPKRDDRWSSIGLAAAMHAGLLFFLWVGVAWQNNEPVAVEAEVWDMTTQTAAPPAPTPPEVKPEPKPEPEPEPTPAPPPKAVTPPPVEAPPPAIDPDIALQKRKAKEKAEKERIEEEKAKKVLEQKKLEDQRKLDEKKKLEEKKLEEKKEVEEKAKEDKAKEEKKAAEKAAKAKAEAEQKKADQRRAADLARIMGTAGAGTTGTAAKATAPRLDSGYVAAITAKIKSNIAYGGGDVAGNPRAEFKIEQLPTGEIISVRKIKSSGIPAYDMAVEAAIAKSSPLPKKKDGSVEREITAGFNMKDLP
jgi:colicin import membrane protein